MPLPPVSAHRWPLDCIRGQRNSVHERPTIFSRLVFAARCVAAVPCNSPRRARGTESCQRMLLARSRQTRAACRALSARCRRSWPVHLTSRVCRSAASAAIPRRSNRLHRALRPMAACETLLRSPNGATTIILVNHGPATRPLEGFWPCGMMDSRFSGPHRPHSGRLDDQAGTAIGADARRRRKPVRRPRSSWPWRC